MSSAWKHLSLSRSSTTLLISKAEDYILFGNKETFKIKKASSVINVPKNIFSCQVKQFFKCDKKWKKSNWSFWYIHLLNTSKQEETQDFRFLQSFSFYACSQIKYWKQRFLEMQVLTIKILTIIFQVKWHSKMYSLYF